MSIDYFVLWTRDFPTPASVGLGTALLPWEDASAPWQRGGHRGKRLAFSFTEKLDFALPKRAASLLTRPTVKTLEVSGGGSFFAIDLAAMGEGLCITEDREILFPTDDAPRTPEQARSAVRGMLWADRNPRPATPCQPLVEAAAGGDEDALAAVRAWCAFEGENPPVLGRSNPGHDVELGELLFSHAQARGPALAALLRALSHMNYYPAARRPDLPSLADAAGLDLSSFIHTAQRDGAERLRWSGTTEPAAVTSRR
jgi:hypothetical protein